MWVGALGEGRGGCHEILENQGTQKKRFGKNPLGCQFGVLGASRRRSVAVVLKSLRIKGHKKKRFGEPHLGCQFGVWARLGGGALR